MSMNYQQPQPKAYLAYLGILLLAITYLSSPPTPNLPLVSTPPHHREIPLPSLLIHTSLLPNHIPPVERDSSSLFCQRPIMLHLAHLNTVISLASPLPVFFLTTHTPTSYLSNSPSPFSSLYLNTPYYLSPVVVGFSSSFWQRPIISYFAHLNTAYSPNGKLGNFNQNSKNMQNKPNFRNARTTVSSVNTMTNNQKLQTMNHQKQTQANPIQTQFWD